MVVGLVVSLKISSIPNIQDIHKKYRRCFMYKTMIKPWLDLFKNREIGNGKDWIDYNQRKLNDVRSLKDIVSNNKRCFNKHIIEQRKG